MFDDTESHAVVIRRLIPFAGQRKVEIGEVGRVIAEGHETVRLLFEDGHEVSYPEAAIKFCWKGYVLEEACTQ